MPSDPEPEHGASRYQNYGCRCDVCKEGSAVKQAKQRERRLNAPREQVPHGPSGYTNWGCHCEVCRESVRGGPSKVAVGV